MLIVDDAVVVRKIVSDTLSGDPLIEVAGVAANGMIAMSKIPQINPDLVTLDIEMPEMDGLQTLAAIRKIYPKLPVIMFSTLTERGAASTMEALSLGATDYVTKPANVGSVSIAMQRIRDELIPKIKAICGKAVGLDPIVAVAGPNPLAAKIQPRVTVPAKPRTPGARKKVEIVAIGISTGGPNALAEFLPMIPGDFPVPIVIVQHMPEFFTKLLADRLSSKSAITVQEGKAGGILQPGFAWLAPGNYHMVVRRNAGGYHIETNQEPPENSCRPAVDVLFRSVVEAFGGSTLGVIMTGMGQDGMLGCRHIADAGGQVVVQDEATSVVWGMPGFVAREGLADKILPLNQIAGELVRRVKEGRLNWNPPTP